MAKQDEGNRGSSDPVTREYRDIQREIDRKDAAADDAGGESQEAPYTGGARQPSPPFPKQHLKKPGLESDLDPRPRYKAPQYRGSGKLEDHAAIITGGDSGIGRAVAVLFAREGADVTIVHLASEQGDANETRAAVEEEGRRCLLLAGDVSQYEFCERVVAQTLEEFGRLDVLVNNAAFQEHAESLEDLSLEHFDRTLKTNLYGYFYMAKAAVPHMQAGASIVNSGSVTGMFGSKELLDYSMTKGGIHAFTRALSENLLDRGIRVNAVAPGPVWTPLNPADTHAEGASQFGSEAPIRRPAQPEELAPAYVFLASGICSSYITGEILPVIGGYNSR